MNSSISSGSSITGLIRRSKCLCEINMSLSWLILISSCRLDIYVESLHSCALLLAGRSAEEIHMLINTGSNEWILFTLVIPYFNKKKRPEKYMRDFRLLMQELVASTTQVQVSMLLCFERRFPGSMKLSSSRDSSISV